MDSSKYKTFIAVYNECGEMVLPQVHEDDKRVRDYYAEADDEPGLHVKTFLYKLIDCDIEEV